MADPESADQLHTAWDDPIPEDEQELELKATEVSYFKNNLSVLWVLFLTSFAFCDD